MELDLSTAFAAYEEQDSGCRSYGIEIDGERRHVKIATTPDAEASLRNAVHFHAVDERTTVFNLGRALHHLLGGTAGRRGLAAQRAVVDGATAAGPEDRPASVGELVAAWRASTPRD